MASRSSGSKSCKHKVLTYLCSPHFGYTDYKPSSTLELEAVAATNGVGSRSNRPRVSAEELPNKHSWSFPAPLVLPQATLEDPDSEPQTYKDWYTEEHRNAVTNKRRTIYLCAAPRISEELEAVYGVSKWAVPRTKIGSLQDQVRPPEYADIAEYLSAFYHGLPVKILEADLTFVPWAEEAPNTKATRGGGGAARLRNPPYIGLATSQECIRIRTRAGGDGIFGRQLNLNDLLDVVASILPKDAYALQMMVNHDIYEGDDDDFCCGRAYGGSRIAVVSTARYNPALDEKDGLDPQHAWPGSHCLDYMLGQCEAFGCDHLGPARKKSKVDKGLTKPTCELLELQPANSPLHKAVTAHHACSVAELSAYELWLGRVCKTASHEFGHCFGLDHCEYYACVMQSTSSCAEDAEQPPYLCPVDQRKVLSATGQGLPETYEALQRFCESRHGSRLWAAFAAWLGARLHELPMSTQIDVGSGDQSNPILLE